jgi:excisionase family DNA binding protein
VQFSHGLSKSSSTLIFRAKSLKGGQPGMNQNPVKQPQNNASRKASISTVAKARAIKRHKLAVESQMMQIQARDSKPKQKTIATGLTLPGKTFKVVEMNHSTEQASPSLERDAVITTREAADMLGVSLRSVQQWVEQGALQAYRTVGGHRRVVKASVERLLSQRRSEVEGRSFRVFIAEDDPDLVALYQMVIKSWKLPLEISVASDGFRALIEIGSLKPDFLILDLNIPGMDGFALIRTLRGMPDLETTDIVTVSGMSLEDIEAKGGLPESVMLLQKPIPFDQLRERIETKLNYLQPKLRNTIT